ncbi:site-specific integrase [Verrucomicrobium spinosum]|uniref:site-specific integrase n=1 Tax=Verrucomicrobium spinosum TaxID=2736 RepID=UPI0012E112F7|nr:hypothetical protein [Verrucomicrobium spinosum]
MFQNNRIDTWRTFLNKCRKWNYWPKGEKHPAELVERAVEPDKIPEIFTVEQAQKILDSVPLKRIPYVVIGGWLGLRPTEMTRIFWERDWDWERRYLHVPPDVARKTMRERYVPIPDAAYEMLAPWRGAKGKCCLTHDREYISKDLRDAGVIEEWPQDVLRHSSISYRIAKGDSIGLVAEHHGNSETEIRQSYRRPLRKEDGEAWFSLRRTVDNGAHVRANSNGTGETL